MGNQWDPPDFHYRLVTEPSGHPEIFGIPYPLFATRKEAEEKRLEIDRYDRYLVMELEVFGI